jgi:hypothetical protein
MEQASYGQKPADGAPLNGRSPIAVKLDNLIRSKLRVSNPYDPTEIAGGLTRFYKGAAEHTRLEEAGLPFYQVQVVQPPRPEMTGPSNFELVQAKSDVGKDLDSLLQNQLTKDIVPELRGWQSAIDNIIADGSEAAPLSLDPRMRDRGFQARRLLGDYARVSRFVGAIWPTLNDNFRALARSLDEVSAVLIVLMGDAIANIGFNGGRFLLQAQASDLQDRRDAVLVALRNLLGSTQVSLDQDTWPRGLQAYQEVITRLDATGNSDLRALFQEANLAKLMDDLIARVNVMSPDGLRALGSTATLQVQPMRRLIELGRRLVDPQSPPFATFLLALQLFVEAFEFSNSGYRLISIARPAIVNYGLYGVSEDDDTTQRLQQLIIARGNLAVRLDYFLDYEFAPDRVRCQIILDKLLYDVDRAIDALSLGMKRRDGAETRAFAYGLIVETLLLGSVVNQALQLEINNALGARRDELTRIQGAFNSGLFENKRTDCLFRVRPGPLGGAATFADARLGSSLVGALQALLPDSSWGGVTVNRSNGAVALPNAVTPLPVPANQSRGTIVREMCMQEDAENQWENLLLTLAPNTFRTAQLERDTTKLVEAARAAHTLPECERVNITIPPDVATSLAGLVYHEPSEGGRGFRG